MFVLRSTYQKQLDKNADLIEDRDSLRRKLLEAQHGAADSTKASFVIDFDQLNPFSIERNVTDGNPCTIFGYFDKEGKVSEWVWYCSMDTHTRVVEEFNGYKAKKENRK